MGRFAAVFCLALLCACASRPQMPAAAGSDSSSAPDVLLLGEQHDAPEHQDMHRQAIQALIARGQLAAVALEMAEQGHSTAGLARLANDAAVQAALGWNESAWPWQAYRPAVMAAVRAGVPVAGANLGRPLLRLAMADPTLDEMLPVPALKSQQQAIRLGHCELLPEAQVAPMTRAQIARDRAMAQTVAQLSVPGKTVVLLAGAGHVDPVLGVPQHLPPLLRVRAVPLPAQAPKKDYCDELKRQMKPGGSPPG